MITYIIAMLSGVGIVCLDQYTKYYINANYESLHSHTLIPKIIDIVYVRNTGAAWGMLKDQTWFLISVTAVVMLICITLILKYGTKNKFLFWAMVFVLSGGIGNLIDRVFRGGRVIDFLHFEFWEDFPVFNIADCAIVLGAVLFVIYFICDLWVEMKSRGRKKHKPGAENEGT